MNPQSLYEACIAQNNQYVVYWFNRNPDQLSQRYGNYEKSLLHFRTSPQILQYLIDRGLNVNERDNIRRSPLHIAAKSGNIEMAEVLIKNGARLNLNCAKKWTALCYAAYAGNGIMCKLLLDAGALIAETHSEAPAHQIAYEKGHQLLGGYIEHGSDSEEESSSEEDY